MYAQTGGMGVISCFEFFFFSFWNRFFLGQFLKSLPSPITENAWGQLIHRIFLNFQFCWICLYRRVKGNLMFLGSSTCGLKDSSNCFLHIPLSKNQVPRTSALFSLLTTPEPSSSWIEKGNILTGTRKSIHAKNYLSGFCCQWLKHRSNLHCWMLYTAAGT